ncbi:MAG: hypothetical protein AB1599_03750 [Planctomycetota bacterium]
MPDANTENNLDLTLLDEPGRKGLWTQILAMIKTLHPVKIYPYIKEGQFISIDNEEVVIGFPRIYNFHRSRLEDVGVMEELERIVEKTCGLKINVALVTINGNGTDTEISREPVTAAKGGSEETERGVAKSAPKAAPVSSDTGAPGNLKYPADDERQLREKVLQDERVRKILETFEGKLVKVRES